MLQFLIVNNICIGDLFRKARPEDFVKFGLIPEFIGTCTYITVALDILDEEALYKILLKPRNALIKQYKKLFELDSIELDFEDDAIKSIAKLAMERKTGARGLRSIMESVMMDSMYKAPSDSKISRVIITKKAVDGIEEPIIERNNENVPKKPIVKKRTKTNSGEIA